MDFKSLGNALFAHHQDTIKLTHREDAFRIGSALINEPSRLTPYIPFSIINRDELTASQIASIYKELLAKCLEELAEQKIPDELAETTLGRDRSTGLVLIFEKGRVTDIDFRGWKQQYPKAAPILLGEAFEFVAEYNPHQPAYWVAPRNQAGHVIEKMPHFNTYFIPTWQRMPEPTTLVCEWVQEYLEPFFEHLFPQIESRKYAKWWLYKLSLRRCQDCLILVGGRGTGKTMLVNLARGLVGEANFKKGSKKLLSKEFNSEFLNSRLVALEETSVTESGYELIKKYMDANIAVEAKGSDPVQITNYASIILTNNVPRKVYCLYDERRYSCPVLTDVSLTDLWDEDKIDAFEKLFMENKEFQTVFAYWLKAEAKSINFPKNRPFITTTFWKLVDASKHPAWKSILNLLKSKPVIIANDVTWRGINGRKVSDNEIRDWIDIEALERAKRGLEPHRVLEEYTEDENVYFRNLTYKQAVSSEVLEEI